MESVKRYLIDTEVQQDESTHKKSSNRTNRLLRWRGQRFVQLLFASLIHKVICCLKIPNMFSSTLSVLSAIIILTPFKVLFRSKCTNSLVPENISFQVPMKMLDIYRGTNGSHLVKKIHVNL